MAKFIGSRQGWNHAYIVKNFIVLSHEA